VSITGSPIQTPPITGRPPDPDRRATQRRVGASDQRRIGLGEALRRYPLVALAPAIVLLAVAAALGLHRRATYTANAQVVIQALAPTASQLPGAIQSAQDLATNQSRLIESDGVTGPLAKKFHTTNEAIANNISATPVPSSTIIRISAQTGSERRSVELANAAAEGFSRYVNGQLLSHAEINKVFAHYRAAALEYGKALLVRQELEHKGKSPFSEALVRAAAVVSAAQLRERALDTEYNNLTQSVSSAPTVSPFVMAKSASSNRSSNLEIDLFAALIAGLLIGSALAVMLANRRVRPA
jgi:capsular polysaccharide biosynthesis protein